MKRQPGRDVFGNKLTGCYVRWVDCPQCDLWRPPDNEIGECACGYTPTEHTREDMNFGQAIEALKAGYSVMRQGWNGKGMKLELQRPDAHSKMSQPYIFINTADGNRVPWVTSQMDVLAEDWAIVK